jgi:alanyl-tRNA synthetase
VLLVQKLHKLVTLWHLTVSDLGFHRPLSEEELVKIESFVNQWIGTATQLESKVMALQDAKNAGAIAMFGEKYGEEVCISFS